MVNSAQSTQDPPSCTHTCTGTGHGFRTCFRRRAGAAIRSETTAGALPIPALARTGFRGRPRQNSAVEIKSTLANATPVVDLMGTWSWALLIATATKAAARGVAGAASRRRHPPRFRQPPTRLTIETTATYVVTRPPARATARPGGGEFYLASSTGVPPTAIKRCAAALHSAPQVEFAAARALAVARAGDVLLPSWPLFRWSSRCGVAGSAEVSPAVMRARRLRGAALVAVAIAQAHDHVPIKRRTTAGKHWLR